VEQKDRNGELHVGKVIACRYEIVDDPEWSQRFKNECEAIGKVSSDHIVRVLDGGVFEKWAVIEASKNFMMRESFTEIQSPQT